jgi:hypothetical protein
MTLTCCKCYAEFPHWNAIVAHWWANHDSRSFR